MTPAEIIAAARECLRTPFRHQGRQIGIGLDCAGLVIAVCDRLGVPYVDVAGYGPNPSHDMLRAVIDQQPSLQAVAPLDRAAGDVLLMRFAGEPQHLAIFTGATIIHSYAHVGQVVEHRLNAVWAARIVQAYRFTGVAS